MRAVATANTQAQVCGHRDPCMSLGTATSDQRQAGAHPGTRVLTPGRACTRTRTYSRRVCTYGFTVTVGWVWTGHTPGLISLGKGGQRPVQTRGGTHGYRIQGQQRIPADHSDLFLSSSGSEIYKP